MSVQSQEKKMRKLAALLGQDLSYIWGEKECGPNGAKRDFLNTGKAFLRALAQDLGLQEVKVSSNAGGIAVSGDCTLSGMWENGGIYINISQPACGGENVILYRAIRDMRDSRGGYNRWMNRSSLWELSYERFLSGFLALKEERYAHERAA